MIDLILNPVFASTVWIAAFHCSFFLFQVLVVGSTLKLSKSMWFTVILNAASETDEQAFLYICRAVILNQCPSAFCIFLLE